MNVFSKLNEAINIIENNLFEDEIDFIKICRILGTNFDTFKNTFSFLTGYSLKEYIKLRRLSECPKFLTDNKVIDVAMMCGYNSRAAFSRAFKKFHGFNPSHFKDNVTLNYFSKIIFNEEELPKSNYKLSIADFNEHILYGEKFEFKNSLEIENFHKYIKEKYEIFKTCKQYYALLYKNKNGFVYYIALDKKFDKNNLSIKIPKCKCLMAHMDFLSKKDIINLGQSIKSKQIRTFPDIEVYSQNGIDLYYRI